MCIIQIIELAVLNIVKVQIESKSQRVLGFFNLFFAVLNIVKVQIESKSQLLNCVMNV